MRFTETLRTVEDRSSSREFRWYSPVRPLTTVVCHDGSRGAFTLRSTGRKPGGAHIRPMPSGFDDHPSCLPMMRRVALIDNALLGPICIARVRGSGEPPSVVMGCLHQHFGAYVGCRVVVRAGV